MRRTKSESDLNIENSECQSTEHSSKTKSKLEAFTKMMFNRAKNGCVDSPNKESGSSSGAWLNKLWYENFLFTYTVYQKFRFLDVAVGET